MNIYWLMVAAVIILGILMPQRGDQRKYYVIIMAILHIFVCGFRYMYMMGDLRKYASMYYELSDQAWFSEEVFDGGRNAGFQWLMKLVSTVTDGDFQIFLILLAVITQVIVAICIFRYSPMPWFSYLVWNCMGFYITYEFSAIKQGLAMAVLMCAMMCIFEKKPAGFLVFTFIAGFIHLPAAAFLPAYFVANRKINVQTILGYIIVAIIIYLFRVPIVAVMSGVYYEDSFELVSNTLGGRFFVIVLIFLCGFALKGFKKKNFEMLFNIMIVAAIFQMFSGFDNVFTRLADYYLQFSVLFIPMIVFESDNEGIINREAAPPLFIFNKQQLMFLAAFIAIILIWWYYRTCLGVTIDNEVDNYLNFRFMWDVIQ